MMSWNFDEFYWKWTFCWKLREWLISCTVSKKTVGDDHFLETSSDSSTSTSFLEYSTTKNLG